MKRVLLISNKVFHYRVSNYNYFHQRFREEGYELFVRADESQKNNPYPIDFDYQEIDFNFKRYKEEIQKIKPDVVFLFLHLKNLIIWPLMLWLKAKGIKFVYWNKGVNLEVKHRWIRDKPFHLVHSLSDAILLYSENEIGDIKKKHHSKLFVANNTINLTAFPKISETKEEIKQEFNILYKKYVLFVGRMRRIKRVEHLIEIFNSIDDPDLGCVIVGDSMDYDIPSMISKENILYLGQVFDPKNEKVSKLFKAADLFCIPGEVGLGLNEAFHWGLPVLTENCFQPPEIQYLKDGINGYMVAENDTASLKEKLMLLLTDDALREKFSKNAKEEIEKNGSIERMFSGFLDTANFLTNS
ncbi:glycosyltransferase family 4 protein [Pelagicoccus sp. SDUM812003]|uniref:glycosyltransferase family 4 protein n=1 Tax=Pelagicoccus sp. SDUM812003 TaxID=3041267 RepID=UPI00280FA43C|nr:glycosyltransferase family 4 protein [Pelagicoccus sp. SDUM812003]MDQ8205003.1 glycosyltransferase family 4 protein [Pelagicoccus sp. SDUM812003]